jgi:hypothetical protein
MFPGAHDIIITNEAGEPLGWEKAPTWEDYWCDDCGFAHAGPCPDEFDPYDNDEEPFEEDLEP